MKHRATSYSAILIVLAMLLMLPARAYACACCFNEGEWHQKSNTVDDYHFNEIDRLVFKPAANLYMTEAGEDMIQGMSTVSESYQVTLAKAQRRWTLTFKDAAGKTGTLTFSIPARMVSFTVDMHDSETPGGAGPGLYHEWRFSGPVSGTGIFKKGMIGQTRFHLVLQGRSNSCVGAEAFANWNLQISGPRASYSFYGSFNQSAAATLATKPETAFLLLKLIAPGGGLSFLS
jgi:hypothetical protein